MASVSTSMLSRSACIFVFFFFQAEDGIRDHCVTGVRRVLFRSYRIGLDIGGTFTDFVLLDAATGRIRIHKCLTTDRKSTRLNSSHTVISYAVFCLKKKKKK